MQIPDRTTPKVYALLSRSGKGTPRQPKLFTECFRPPAESSAFSDVLLLVLIEPLAGANSPSSVNTMVPDQVMDAIHFAEFIMAKEKTDRIGSFAAAVYPMKFFLFHDQKEIMGLLGSPFRHPTLDDKDVMALVIRMFSLALDAKAVLHATEAWIATRCAACGTSVTEMKDQKCSICGSEMVSPSENSHREELCSAR